MKPKYREGEALGLACCELVGSRVTMVVVSSLPKDSDHAPSEGPRLCSWGVCRVLAQRPGTCVWMQRDGRGCGRDAVRFLRVTDGDPRWYLCGTHAAITLCGRG